MIGYLIGFIHVASLVEVCGWGAISCTMEPSRYGGRCLPNLEVLKVIGMHEQREDLRMSADQALQPIRYEGLANMQHGDADMTSADGAFGFRRRPNALRPDYIRDVLDCTHRSCCRACVRLDVPLRPCSGLLEACLM
jgi:hypothetical protein